MPTGIQEKSVHMSTMAIRIHELGGPEVLRWESVEVGEPGPGEVLVRHLAVGLNFIDTYHRSGLYPVEPLPAVLGMEASGVVEALGPAAPGGGGPTLEVGNRVAYGSVRGAYCERRVLPAGRLVKLPDAVEHETAASAMLKGLTSWYLARRLHAVCRGDTVLVHAAAGGVGTILCQWCKALGATVIGTVGSAEKARLAGESGCDHTINYTEEDFVERVREITGGHGVPVVYDGVGEATFDGSMECLARFGMMATFGNASGPVPPFNILRLSPKALTLARPTLGPFIDHREDLEEGAGELFGLIESGQMRITVGQRFPLAEAAMAQRALEARETKGCTVLVP